MKPGITSIIEASPQFHGPWSSEAKRGAPALGLPRVSGDPIEKGLVPARRVGSCLPSDAAGVRNAMVTTVFSDSFGTELSAALIRVASTPGQSDHLHEILRAYCHQSRNLLNCMNMSLYLARKGATTDGSSCWNEIEARYRNVEQFIDRIQLICRPMPLNLVRLPLSLLFEDRTEVWTDQLAAVGRKLVIDGPAQPGVGNFDPVRLGQAFDDVVAWRVRLGPLDTDLRIQWTADDCQFLVLWDEPDRSSLRVRPEAHPEPGVADLESLTVPLLTRIVTLHGGWLDLVGSGRWRISLRWPLDASST